MNKIEFLKFIDSSIGKALSLLLSSTKERQWNYKVVKSILIIRPGGIGDAVLLIPAIQQLKKKFKDISIDILCEKRNAGIFALVPDIRHVFLYDKGLDLVRCMKGTYEAVVDTEQWHRLSAVVAKLIRAPLRIGFGTNERSKLFTHAVPYSHDDYEVNSFLRLISPLCQEEVIFDPEKPFLDVSRVSLGGLSHLVKFEKEKTFIGIFPGASVPERRWGGNRYGTVAKRLIDQGFRVVILGGKGDREEANTIVKAAPSAIDLTGKTSLSGAAALLARCRLLITADSGLMHIAFAVGTPTLSLFGSGIQKKWAPPGSCHTAINKRLSCSPCTRFGYTPHCKRNVECITSVTVEDVIESAENVLKGELTHP